MTTKYVRCVCESPYLDKKLGKGIRVANLAEGLKAKKQADHWRCAVCKRLHS